ncbi:unnamed protein product [Knipowitschia caucasica]
MPSFVVLKRVEHYIRTKTFPPNSSHTMQSSTRRISKLFVYKDGVLLRKYRGRLLQAVMSDEEVREIMVRFHDNNNHAGRARMVREIMSLYYWVGVTEAVKSYISSCVQCKSRTGREHSEVVMTCLAYGCDGSSYLYPELTFHSFPRPGQRRQLWLAAAQRDEGSVRKGSKLCSRHFPPECFQQKDDDSEELRPEAVPSVTMATKQESDCEDPLFGSSSLEDLLSGATASAQEHHGHQEHQYSQRVPDLDQRETPDLESKSRQSATFTTYNHIARYLSHRILPPQNKRTKGSLRRTAKRFSLIDGVLYYNLRTRQVRVPRSREEVIAILQQYHDNSGHYGHGACFRSMVRHFYWSTMRRDLSCWISRCSTCSTRSKRKWLRCSVMSCTNCSGPVERKLGLTFHNFPIHSPALLARWQKAAGRPHWYPHLWSSVCSAHFTEDCFNREGGGGERRELRPDAVPTIKVHGDKGIKSRNEGCAAVEMEEDQEDAFFAKYSAVQLYISSRTYPPGLTFVEKNTFRRFCKKFFVKDGVLHIRLRSRSVPVLRSRQQVREALTEFHDELNHLDFTKCLRLLNERCHWRTMRSDITLWISKCAVCQLKDQNHRRQRGSSDSEQSDVFSNKSESDAEIEVKKVQQKLQTKVQTKTPVQLKAASARKQTQNQVQTQRSAETKAQPTVDLHFPIEELVQTQVIQKVQSELQVQFPSPFQSPLPILVHMGPPLNLQSGGSFLLSTSHNIFTSHNTLTTQNAVMTPIWAQDHRPVVPKPVQTPDQSSVVSKPVQTPDQRPAIQKPVQTLDQTPAIPKPVQTPDQTPAIPKPVQARPSSERPTHSSRGRPLKRKHFADEEISPKIRGESGDPNANGQQETGDPNVKGQRETADPNTNVQGANINHTVQYHRSEVNRRVNVGRVEPSTRIQDGDQSVSRSKPETSKTTEITEITQRRRQRDTRTDSIRGRPLEARVVVQQCGTARVKTRPGVNGRESEYAQIGAGLVVYVCFYKGATDDTTQRIADAVMHTRFFRSSSGSSSSRRLLSVLDLPGEVLLLPQESLGSEPGPRRVMQPQHVVQAWTGQRLFSTLHYHCTQMGGAVEQGLYGQKQEIQMSSTDPMSHVLEF